MDRGIWATWYDLDEGDRDSFLAWSHSTYLPALASSRRYNWVAHYHDSEAIESETGVAGKMEQADASEDIPVGRQFLMLVGANSPHVFLDPLVLSREGGAHIDGLMLSRRRNVRHAIFVEEASADGPSVGEVGSEYLPAPAIRLGCFRMRIPEDDFEAGEWYAQNRLPHMAAAPGCVRVRKLLSVAGWAKHAILYEFVSADARRTIWNSLRADRNRDRDRFWSIGPKTVHAPGSPTLGERTFPEP